MGFEKNFFLSCILFSNITLSCFAADGCPSFDLARQKYLEGDVHTALAILRCRKKNRYRDFDSRRFLSDIYWWENLTDLSVKEAKIILSHLDPDQDDELFLFMGRRIRRFRISGDMEYSQSENSSGIDKRAEFDARYYKNNHFLASYARLTRTFADTPKLSDTLLSVSNIGPIIKRVYQESTITYSPDPTFSPRWAFLIEPHYVFVDDSDVGVGYKINRYNNSRIAEFRLSWDRSFGEWFRMGTKEYVVLLSPRLLSGSIFLECFLRHRFTIRVDGATGKTLEDENRIGYFWSSALSFKYQLVVPLALRVSGIKYQGNLRTENRFTFGFDLFF